MPNTKVDYQDIEVINNELEKLIDLYAEACHESAVATGLYKTLEIKQKVVRAFCFEDLAGKKDAAGKTYSVSDREMACYNHVKYKEFAKRLVAATSDYHIKWAKERTLEERIRILKTKMSSIQSVMKV